MNIYAVWRNQYNEFEKKWLWLNAMIYGLEMTGNPEYEVSFTSQKHSFDECHWQKFFILFDHAEAEKKIP